MTQTPSQAVTLFLLSQMEMDLLEARLQGQGRALKPRGDSPLPSQVPHRCQVSGCPSRDGFRQQMAAPCEEEGEGQLRHLVEDRLGMALLELAAMHLVPEELSLFRRRD